MPKQAPVTTVTDPRWLRAISHPIRVRLLAMLEEEPASPVILAAKLDQPLGTIAYHVRTLYELGLLKLVSTRQRRGATEHYYRAAGLPRASDEAWTGLDAVSKQRLLTALLTKAHDYATRSAAAGGFDREGASFVSNALKLDEQGWSELAEEARQWLERAQEIERNAAVRINQAPDSKIDVGLTLQLFEGRPFSSSDASDEQSAGKTQAGAAGH
jgi:DNA-binding transcriptional ArsR family regulator